MTSSKTKFSQLTIVVIVLLILGSAAYYMHEQRTGSETESVAAASDDAGDAIDTDSQTETASAGEAGTITDEAPSETIAASGDTGSEATPGAADEANVANGDATAENVEATGPAPIKPSFDIVRVEPTGDAVLAGRSDQDAEIEILSNGQVLAVGRADADGQWVVTLDDPLKPGGHDLTVRAVAGDGLKIVSDEKVAIAVPATPDGEVLVVANVPGQPSEVLAKPSGEAVEIKPDAEGGAEVAAVGQTGASQDSGSASVSSETSDAAAPETGSAVAGGGVTADTGAPDTAAVADASGNATGDAVTNDVAGQGATTNAEATPPSTAETATSSDVAPTETVAQAPVAPTEPSATATEIEASTEQPADQSTTEPVVADAATAGTEGTEASPPPVSVEAVEVEGEKLFAAGAAEAGSTVRLYVDNELVGETKASGEGRWLVEGETPEVGEGPVTVRADELVSNQGDVAARAEVDFVRQPDQLALIPAAAIANNAARSVQASGSAVQPETVIIRKGDNLWTISRRTYGQGVRFSTIHTANDHQIRDPHLIYPGQVFVLPTRDRAWEN